MTTNYKHCKKLVMTTDVAVCQCDGDAARSDGYVRQFLNGGITMCLDTYCDIISVCQNNCFYYTI